MLALQMFVLALAGKCCCDRGEAELPTTCLYLKNGKNCAATYGDQGLPYKVLPNDRSTSATDCEAMVKQNGAALEIKRGREVHAHAKAIRESQPAFSADQALAAAKHNQNKDWRGPEVAGFYTELAKMGYKQEDILWALERNQYTSVQGTVRTLEIEGIQPDPSGPERDAYRPGAAKDTAEPATELDPALPAEWKHVPADGKDVVQEYWQYEGSQTWSYHKPVVIAGGWMCIVAPAANGMDETPYYWNMETGTTSYEAPEEAVTSFGLDCPVLPKRQPATHEEPVSQANRFSAHTYAGAGAFVETAAGAAARSREEPRVARRHVPVGANGF